MKNALIILFIILTRQGIACINEYRTLLSGQVIYTDEIHGFYRPEKLDTVSLLLKLAELDSLYKVDGSVETLSDYGVILIYLGRFPAAIDLYRRIEQQEPDLYATAANMGTTFELLGEIDSADFYIRKAIVINPDSHYGSEWIHLKILEAKKKLLADPLYLESANILNLDFGQEGKPVNIKDEDLTALEDQLRFQLFERMTFVEAPDLIVGQLLFDLGNICALTRDVHVALECYELSLEYGFRSDMLDQRISALKPLALKATVISSAKKAIIKNPIFYLAVVVLLGFGLIWIIIKMRKRKINNSTKNVGL